MSDGGVNRAYLSLGSNIQPERNLPAAIAALAAYGTIAGASGVWESEPVGDPHQANFLNAAVLLETNLTAQSLKQDAIAGIERRLGRVRDPRNRNAARTIDIDVALFNRDVLRVGGSAIPDPEIIERPYLAVPLAELDADYRHPTDGRTLREIAQGLSPNGLIPRPDVALIADDEKGPR
jgi:2-amino-4-hydroxy-6-hydroxymethyldihydropteridine diphosphokinase